MMPQRPQSSEFYATRLAAQRAQMARTDRALAELETALAPLRRAAIDAAVLAQQLYHCETQGIVLRDDPEYFAVQAAAHHAKSRLLGLRGEKERLEAAQEAERRDLEHLEERADEAARWEAVLVARPDLAAHLNTALAELDQAAADPTLSSTVRIRRQGIAATHIDALERQVAELARTMPRRRRPSDPPS